jgi:hypothetical protein
MLILLKRGDRVWRDTFEITMQVEVMLQELGLRGEFTEIMEVGEVKVDMGNLLVDHHEVSIGEVICEEFNG